MKVNFTNSILSLALIILSVLSCKQVKKERSKEFAFEMSTWSFRAPKVEVFLYNLDLSLYTRERYLINKGELNENTLYVLKTDYKDTFKVVDTLRVKLNESQVDSLYSLAKDYLSTIDMDNEVKVEDNQKVKIIQNHGNNFSVSLKYKNKQLTATETLYDTGLSKQGIQLFAFIKKKLPEDFRF